MKSLQFDVNFEIICCLCKMWTTSHAGFIYWILSMFSKLKNLCSFPLNTYFDVFCEIIFLYTFFVSDYDNKCYDFVSFRLHCLEKFTGRRHCNSVCQKICSQKELARSREARLPLSSSGSLPTKRQRKEAAEGSRIVQDWFCVPCVYLHQDVTYRLGLVKYHNVLALSGPLSHDRLSTPLCPCFLVHLQFCTSLWCMLFVYVCVLLNDPYHVLHRFHEASRTFTTQALE